MIRYKILPIIILFICFISKGISQVDSTQTVKDSVNIALLDSYNKRLIEIEKQRLEDSIQKLELAKQISSLKTTDNLKKEELQAKLQAITELENSRLKDKKARIDSLKNKTKGYPVVGFFNDTLFVLYSNLGSFSPKERAEAVNKRIEKLGSDINFNENSLKAVNAETSEDIVLDEVIIMSITETDALWNNTSKEELANQYLEKINEAVLKYKEETDYVNLAIKIEIGRAHV